jgi:hypothetical protein
MGRGDGVGQSPHPRSLVAADAADDGGHVTQIDIDAVDQASHPQRTGGLCLASAGA